MAIYFVNAAGSSTAPYNTVIKGAVNFATLIAGIVWADSDIVNVVNDGEIDDSANVVNLLGLTNVTVRSWSGNAGKPTVKVKYQASGDYYGFDIDACTNFTIQGIKFLRDCGGGAQNDTWGVMIGHADLSNNNITIENCEFLVQNYSADGFDVGLYFNENETTIVKGCKFVNFSNSAICGGSFTVINSIFDNCGISLWFGSGAASVIKIVNNTIYNTNSWSDLNSGGVQAIAVFGHVTIVNNICSGVHGAFPSTGILVESGSTNDLQDYNNVYGSFTWPYGGTVEGAHSIHVDPLFVNAAGGNFHLQASSPCIGAGASTAIDPNIPVIDYDGVSRPQGANWDMGAYEYLGGPVTCWEFVAKYLGSNRLFKMNGPGLFPKELKVPRNLDLRSARMIDVGKLIDPKQYRLL